MLLRRRILHIQLITNHKHLHTVFVYSPEDCKPKAEKDAFREELQNILPRKRKPCSNGRFQCQIGKNILPCIKQIYHENALNVNGESVIDTT